MRCPQCDSTNPDAALHCGSCGAALAPPLSLPLVPQALAVEQELALAREALQRLRRYVPPVVAEGVLNDQERLRGERREVAVLFADAVNFTHLSASLDAESVFGLINELLGRLVDCVQRYDGVVDKFTGDGLMAIFGAPIAHESDSELAVRAALDMQRAAAEFEPVARAKVGAPLQIRVGVHCGPVVAGIIGTEQQAAYTVIGETVNLAARLESLARPGCVLVSSRVYHQTRPLFNFKSLDTLQVKGVDEPLAVYEVVGDRSEPLSTRGVTGVTAIVLGRDAELAQMRALTDAFLQDKHGRLLLIQGEAGIGKSRLVSEWLSSIPADQVTVRQGRGLPYAQGVGYGVFRSLLQDAVRSSLPGAAWDARVSPALRLFLWQVLGTLSPEEQTTLRYLEPERIKQLTVLAVREWILGEARSRPLVLILDDFHWADDLSRDMLQSLVKLIHEAPLLLCVMARPQPEAPIEVEAPPSPVPLAEPLAVRLELRPLSQTHARKLLGHLVDLRGLPEPFVETLLTRAQGFPFYIEEFVRILIEKEMLKLRAGQWQVVSAVSLQALEIPTTLRGLMMARVDRLPEDLQNVLRSAAVVGLQFSARLLEEVERRLHGTLNVLPALERLIDLDLLLERPQAGEQVYAFRHILTQETIYHSLLRSQRPLLHRTVAECIEYLYADDLNGQAEILALHYDRASVRDRAMHYAVVSGDRARQRFANREAIEYYSRALQLSQHLSAFEPERWQAAVGLGEVQQHIGEYEEAIACYRAALEEGEDVVPEGRASAMLHLAQVWDKRGDLQEAEGWLHQGLAQLARGAGTFPELRAQIYSELGWINLRRGDLAAAQSIMEQGLALVGGTEHYGVLSSILNRLGAVHFHRSEWDRAAECVERALELRERLGDLVGVARSSNNLGIIKKNSGDWNNALVHYQRAVELHERNGEAEGLVQAYTNLGVLCTDRGEWSQAEHYLHRSFDLVRQIAHPYELAQAHMNLGRLYLLQGQWAECARHLNMAVPLYTEAGARANVNLNDAYNLQGRLCLEQGQIDLAQQWADRCYKLLQTVTGTKVEESVEWGRYEQLVGRIAQARGDWTSARQHLERSADIFQTCGSQLEAGRTAYWSGMLSIQIGELARARTVLLAARRIFEQLGAGADLARVEQQLAHVP